MKGRRNGRYNNLQIGKGCRLYRTQRLRSIAVTRMIQAGTANYFVGFKQTQTEEVGNRTFGLCYAKVDWTDLYTRDVRSARWERDNRARVARDEEEAK